MDKLFVILICCILIYAPGIIEHPSAQQIVHYSQENILDADIYLITDTDPYNTLLTTTMACTYPNNISTAQIKPLLLNPSSTLEPQHQRFIESYTIDSLIAVIGTPIDLAYETSTYELSPPMLSLHIASLSSPSSKALIIPYNISYYTESLLAIPLSCYLHIPLLIFDDNTEEINQLIIEKNITELYIIGDINPDDFNSKINHVLPNTHSITSTLLKTIKDQFNSLNYITITNPLDIIEKQVISTWTRNETHPISTIQCIIGGKTITLSGTDHISTTLTMPEGIHHLQCRVTYSPLLEKLSILNMIDPYVYCVLYDPENNIIGYSMSPSCEKGTLTIDTLITDFPGTYTLSLSIYHGIRGGFFSTRGISLVKGEVTISIKDDHLHTSHLPHLPFLSTLAPYLTSVYGGIIIANESFSLTSPEYDVTAKGYATGPWYQEKLHPFNNEQVNKTVNEIHHHLELLDEYDLLGSYLTGPAWLALMGDTNMIPMYYYHPSQHGIPEKGLPSDNPYSLNATLSTGRIMGYSSADVSNLLCRTFFYETICQHHFDSMWADSFHFMYGEGFGETGGLFHQVPYAKEIESYGFHSEVYGDLRNSRQYAESYDVFTGANYNEYLGHGDWFWFVPSLYGLDSLSKSFDVSHLKNWVFPYPSVFLTSACLMGRVDGISPDMNIGMTLLHAGCNAFIGATRETGQEAGLEILENSLIVNNTSIGEALREEKQMDTIGPTYYVRILYGDPAFNPYEPCNGFTRP